MKLQKDDIGKKVVFVHPPELVRRHLLGFLTGKEYEVYTLQDHTKIQSINSTYPGTIFFLNIDTALKEFEWEDLIKKLRRKYPELQLGIFSFKITDAQRIQHYLMNLGVNCGFVQMKQGVKTAADMMLKILQANEARGKRKYICYRCSDKQAFLNFKAEEEHISGTIVEISSVGMSFVPKKDIKLTKYQVVKDIQLRLKGILVNTHGIVLGKRETKGRILYVVLFNSPDLQKVRERIHWYIRTALQKKFDEEFC